MKKIIFIFMLVTTFAGFSQQWQSSYVDAVANAKALQKPMLLVFSGSDWCAPCIKMDKRIWRSEAFRSYARNNYVLYKADFPKKNANRLPLAVAEQNRELAAKYNPKGHFPHVVLLGGNEKILGQTGYRRGTPKAYLNHLKSFIK
ncbi:thioredoxin family protein [Pricia sp. S334]|uniref:Thioredoxin family protein n=1 Tax=Pricia mediterranea TaxID=3076079 RepID=A0ABU3L7L4_9FLAO|nr:thioredoxin family protein [Pricia sp. S334]MDT7829665.1 thioredoxin family protein [Pricia sp. S334]